MAAVSKARRQAIAAYAAGFFDGEGCINCYKRSASHNGYTLRLSFTNRDISVLEWIQSVFGGKIYRKARYSVKHAQAFELVILRKAQIKELLTQIRPFCRVKSKQVEVAFAILNSPHVRLVVTELRGKTWPLISGHPEDLAAKEALRQELLEANKRGPICLH